MKAMEIYKDSKNWGAYNLGLEESAELLSACWGPLFPLRLLIQKVKAVTIGAEAEQRFL